MGNFIYIMGKSASGKDTVGKILKDKLNIKNYVMYTTRPIRDGEKEGVDYFYVSKEKIEEFRNEGKVIESRTYNTVHGPWTYATINDSQLEENQNILGVGTLESYKNVREYFLRNGKNNLLPVYIEIDEEERRKRAIKREETQAVPKFEEMERRLKADNIDFSEENLILAGIKENQRFKNYDLNTCVNEIIKYVKEREENKICQETEETKEVQM